MLQFDNTTEICVQKAAQSKGTVNIRDLTSLITTGSFSEMLQTVLRIRDPVLF